MPTMLTTNGILDDALSLIQDNSTSQRSKMLSWLNVCLQRLATERPWKFLEKTTTLTVSSNMIAKPSDFAKFAYAKKGSDWMLLENDRLTDEEAFAQGTTTATNPVAKGFTENDTSILFHPGAAGDVELKYIREIPAYADQSSTIVPIQFGPLLKRACLDYYYEYDMDERMASSFQFEASEMLRLKKWDNSQRAVQKRTQEGYLRGRL